MARRKLTASQKRQRGLALSKAFRTRENKSYRQKAKALSVYVPELKPLAKKSIYTAKEKAKITRRAKQLQHVSGLKPVTKAQAKRLKGALFAPGVQAVQLRDVHDAAQLRTVGNDLLITQNGRTWIYWRLDRATVKSKRGMKDAAEKAFNAQYPIERVAALAEMAFRTLKPLAVHLWVTSGRAAEGYEDFKAFVRYVDEKWQAGRYISTTERGKEYESDPEKFINGIAILVSEVKLKETKSTPGRKVSEMG